MPATSIKQRRFFAIAEHHPEELRDKMPDMSKDQMHDYAETSEQHLPMKASGPKTALRRRALR